MVDPAVLIGIGDFARMTFMSVKTLRHYHDVGVLVPAEVDLATGYRRYTRAQLADAHLVRRFRELDMPLDDVREVQRAPDVETRNAIVAAHLARMERHLADTRDRVASLRALLAGVPVEHPTVRYETRPAQPVLIIRDVVDAAQVVDWRVDALRELRDALATADVRRDGPDAGLYSRSLLEDERGEIGAVIPVAAAPALATGRVRSSVVAAGEYAVAEHVGAHDDLDRTFAAVGAVVTARGVAAEGPIREDYVVGELDTDRTDRFRTVVCWPVGLHRAPIG